MGEINLESNDEDDEDKEKLNPGEKETKKVIDHEIKQKKRVRIYESNRTRASPGDKEAFLEKNTIVGSKKDIERRLVK